jgi:hypothetical protein
MNLSIIIASHRPVGYINNVINKIKSLETSLEYEILVSHPEQIDGVINVPELNAGPIPAYNQLAREAKGEIIAGLTDCTPPRYNFFDLYEEATKVFDSRTLKVLGMNIECGGHCYVPGFIPFEPRPQIIRFPVFNRDSLHKEFNGFYFNPSFKYHVGDNWLGVWCSLMGEPAYELENIHLAHSTPHEYVGQYDAQEDAIMLKLFHNFQVDKSYNATLKD